MILKNFLTVFGRFFHGSGSGLRKKSNPVPDPELPGSKTLGITPYELLVFVFYTPCTAVFRKKTVNAVSTYLNISHFY